MNFSARQASEAPVSWEDSVRRVAGLGFDPDEVAQAAGLSRRELNRILREGPSTS
jgi:hypothetical protein